MKRMKKTPNRLNPFCIFVIFFDDGFLMMRKTMGIFVYICV